MTKVEQSRYNKEYYKKNAEAIRKKARDWGRENSIQKQDTNKKECQRRKKEAMDAYGGICSCCGEDNLVFLAIDHIDGNGASHRKSVASGTTMYRWLKKNNYPPGFQVLCHNCNWAKYLVGTCPHKLVKNSPSNNTMSI